MGGGGFGNPGRGFETTEELTELFKALKDGGCSHIDTAALYGPSEETLGKVKAGDQFILDTKMKGGFGGNGHSTKENILAEAENSKKMLGCDVDIYYLHGK